MKPADLLSATFALGNVASHVTPAFLGGERAADGADDSSLVQRLISSARRVEDQQKNGGGVDFDWVADFSVKFQGCHHITQWESGDGDAASSRLSTRRLVRFRFCPNGSCALEGTSGCDSGYGDYVIDMAAYLEAYLGYKLGRQERHCQFYQYYICGCADADNEEYCLYDCFMANDMDYCVEDNPYVDDDNDEDKFEVYNYLECAEWYPANGNERRHRRRLEDGNDDENDEEDRYYIGPYCSDGGEDIFLGLFTDEFCTNFAPDDLYLSVIGEDLPHSTESVVGQECTSCKEPQDPGEKNYDDDNCDDQEDEDLVVEMCEQLYTKAGRCESSLLSVVDEPDETACNYIQGISIMRRDGVVVQASNAGSGIFPALIGIFCTSFILLTGYVYYLSTQIVRTKVDLLNLHN